MLEELALLSKIEEPGALKESSSGKISWPKEIKENEVTLKKILN